jgi:hypothetical protein
MWGKLTIIDSESWVYVAPNQDPEDWVARFEKAEDFPALEWAERMVALYNSDLRARESPALWHHRPRPPETPPASSYPPFDPTAMTAP